MSDAPQQAPRAKAAIPELFRVEINGQPWELVPQIGDLVRFERKYGKFDDEGMLEDIEQVAYLLWCMARRMHAIGPDVEFDDFLDALGPVEPVARPKAQPKKRSAGSSPRRGLTGVA
jgi:hypothetical protein